MSKHRRLPALTVAATAAAWCLAPIDAAAQGRASDAYLNRQRALEDDVRAQMERDLPIDQKIDFDWGGWYNTWFMLFDDGVNSSRTLRRNDFRLWGGLTLDQGAHEFYARMRMSYLDFNRGDSYDGNEDDLDGPNLERGYYQFDLQRAMRAYQGKNTPNNFKLKLGRDLVEFGTGYALSLPLDQVLMTADVGKFELTGLVAQSVRSTKDIDRTRPGSEHMDRAFYGAQVKYKGFQKHEPFAYVFWNDDKSGQPPWWRLQRYGYDSFYAGLGSQGELWRNLRYSTEWVFETGESHRYLHCGTADIRAWAWDATLEYLSQRPMKPRFLAEYMFASGDSDRLGSPTGTIGGNRWGDDTSFSGFGYRDTGLSLAPRLSNVHIWRAGASFLPFEEHDWLDRLELGTDWFLFWKNRSDGAISDPTADERSGYLGWEMDYFANWRITSDLSLTVRYGTFFPGEAFSDETTRTFFLTGLTWSF